MYEQQARENAQGCRWRVRERARWATGACWLVLISALASACSESASRAEDDAGATQDVAVDATLDQDTGARPEDAAPTGPVLLAVEPAEGPTQGLTTVELVGAGLDSATSVWFGDSKALDVEVLGEDRLRCRTPPHPAGDVTVRVLREDAKALPLPELSLDLAFRYVATVHVDGVEPDSGPADGATLVSIRGTGFLPGTQFIFGTKLAISPTILDEFNATALLPAGEVGVVDVIATNSDGQARLVDAFTYTEAASPPELQGVTLAWIKPERLAPKGGTKVELRYAAPADLGPVLGVRIGPLDAAKLATGSQGPQSLTMTGPAGSPGWADVRLFFSSGVALFPKKVRFASDLPHLAAILPSRGSQAGGTLVDLVGDGVDTLSVVQFAGKDAIGIEVVDAGLARTRTPPAEAPGPVTVVARFGSKQSPKGQSLLKNGYIYFDPAQEAWGTWGSPIERALNVTVMRADWPGGVVADALVVIGDGKDVELRGMTDQRGQVVISTIGLEGPLDVSASKPGWGAATIAGTESENATLLIRKYPEQGNGTFEWPKKFYTDGTIRGRVLNAAKYAGLPRGRCPANAAPGAGCSPCGGGLSCAAGTTCLAADAPVWPATGVTATATGLCLQPCTKDSDCGDEAWECRFVASVPTSLPNPTTQTGASAGGTGGVPTGAVAPVAACIPRVGKAQTRCETTQSWMFSTNPDPGSGAIVDDKGNFEIQTRLGSLAVACRAGYVDAKSGAFIALWLGVKRSVEVPDDIHPVAIDVTLDTRLGRSLPVRMAGLPMGPDSVGKIRSMTAWLDLGGEGVLEMASASETGRTDVLVLHGLPTTLTGALSGLRYELYGGLISEFGDEGAPLSLGHFLQQQPTDGEGMVWWPQGEPGPISSDAGAAPTVATASGAAGTYAVGRGGRILFWTGGSWTPQAQPTETDLATIWLDPTLNDGWIGGAQGSLLRRDPTLGWQATPSPTATTIIGLVGAAPGIDAGALWLLAQDGTLWRRAGGAWTLTAEGPWPVGSAATTQGEGPTALARLDDGGLAVATSEGAVYVAAPASLALGGTPIWSLRIPASGLPLRALTGTSVADLWACGVDGRLLHAVGTNPPASLVPTDTTATLLGLLRLDGALHVVGANGTWLEIAEPLAAPAPKVKQHSVPDVSADLRGLAATSAGLVTVGEPVLSLERWLEMPAWVAPLADEPLPDELKWTWPGGAKADLQWLQITTYWQVSYWDLAVAGHRNSVVLPDFSQIGGWQPLPSGPLRMRLSRLYAPSLAIDHFSQDQLVWYAWTTWAFTQHMSYVPGLTP